MMLKSQLPAATAWHLGNWNTIWRNYFLDYTSSLKKICFDIKAKVKLRGFVKWGLQILPMLLGVSFPDHLTSLSVPLLDSNLGKSEQHSAYKEWFQVVYGICVLFQVW